MRLERKKSICKEEIRRESYGRILDTIHFGHNLRHPPLALGAPEISQKHHFLHLKFNNIYIKIAKKGYNECI